MNMKIIKIIGVLAVLTFFSGSTFPASAGTASATVQLKTSIDQILDVLRDPELKADNQKGARREKLRAIAGQRFDYRRMSQMSLARHWKERNDGEKEEFTLLFSALLEDAYMSKIESYTDEKVVFLKEQIKINKEKEYAKINTKIITQSAEIPIDYMMFRVGDGPWLVYDMVIEGVSMVNNYRSQFGQILERESFATLIQQLKDKNK